MQLGSGKKALTDDPVAARDDCDERRAANDDRRGRRVVQPVCVDHHHLDAVLAARVERVPAPPSRYPYFRRRSGARIVRFLF